MFRGSAPRPCRGSPRGIPDRRSGLKPRMSSSAHKYAGEVWRGSAPPAARFAQQSATKPCRESDFASKQRSRPEHGSRHDGGYHGQTYQTRRSRLLSRSSLNAAGLSRPRRASKPACKRCMGDVELQEKLGRNDPCPCGSGQRFKRCCLKSGAYDGSRREYYFPRAPVTRRSNFTPPAPYVGRPRPPSHQFPSRSAGSRPRSRRRKSRRLR